MKPLSVEPGTPFGAVITLPAETPFDAIPPEQIHVWVAQHRVVVLRGVRRLDRTALPLAARRLGPLQAWSFGSVHELRVRPRTDNYLYTDRAVPLHWDGAFAGEAPRYLVFHCVEAPDGGGETEFVDTARVWADLDEPTRDRYRALRFRYATEHRAHYGGSFVSPLVVQHEERGGAVLRFAEPVDDLNPVSVEAVGVDPSRAGEIIGEIRGRLRRAEYLLAHAWRTGDVVIADNLGLLHGRRAFDQADERLIRRVNILRERPRSLLATLRAAARIRRPEFMVAELPIFLIPLVLFEGVVTIGTVAPLAVLFVLLFHVGDMVNCLADRDLDLVYKPRLAEAVRTLGVRQVAAQIIASCVAALAIAVELSVRSGHWETLLLTATGLALGLQYSLRPVYFKGRGVLQIVALWAIVFIGPMLLVWTTLGGGRDPIALALFGLYGVMQQGIILVNTAEDLPEDRALGVRTSALALGVPGALRLASVMVLAGGAGVAAAAGWLVAARGRPIVVSLLPLLVALLVIAASVERARRAVVEAGRAAEDRIAEARVAEILRKDSRHVPVWITATAAASLFAVAVARC